MWYLYTTENQLDIRKDEIWKNKSDEKSQEPYNLILMWNIKPEAINEQTDKQKLMDTDNSMVVTRGKGGVVVKGEGGQIHGDRRRFDFG